VRVLDSAAKTRQELVKDVVGVSAGDE